MNIEKMFSTIDTHVAGEAFRIVIQSSIHLNEENIEKNQQLLQRSFQNEKDFLLKEPRGHRGMNGCMIISSDVADYGLLFFNHHQKKPFNYGGLVTSVTALIETGNLKTRKNGVYKIETIQGVYEVHLNFDQQEGTKVYLENNACKVVERNDMYQLVEVDGARMYAIFPLPKSIPTIAIDYLMHIQKWGRTAVQKLTNEHILFDGIIITEQLGIEKNEIRSVTFEKDGNITRSPGIDSTFAIFTALLQTTNKFNQLTNHSIFDSSITAYYLPETLNRFSVEIQGFTTGVHQFIYDQTDPLKNGFLLK